MPDEVMELLRLHDWPGNTPRPPVRGVATEIGFYFLKQAAKYRYAQTTISSAAPTPDGCNWPGGLLVSGTITQDGLGVGVVH